MAADLTRCLSWPVAAVRGRGGPRRRSGIETAVRPGQYRVLHFPAGPPDVSVRIPWGCSSAGRAPRSHRGGQGFESPHLHHRGSVGQVVSPRVCKTLAFGCGGSIPPRPTSSPLRSSRRGRAPGAWRAPPWPPTQRQPRTRPRRGRSRGTLGVHCSGLQRVAVASPGHRRRLGTPGVQPGGYGWLLNAGRSAWRHTVADIRRSERSAFSGIPRGIPGGIPPGRRGASLRRQSSAAWSSGPCRRNQRRQAA